MPDHRTSLSIEHDPIAVEGLVAVKTPQDDYVIGIDLWEDWVSPRREVWDIDELPCLRSQPEHLHGAQQAIVTLTAGNVDLVVYSDGRVIATRDI